MPPTRKPTDAAPHGIKLLVIDDDRKLCRLIRDYLSPFGYEVEVAHTGPEGLEKALAGEHAAVLLEGDSELQESDAGGVRSQYPIALCADAEKISISVGPGRNLSLSAG